MSGSKVDMPALGFGMGDVVLGNVLNGRGPQVKIKTLATREETLVSHEDLVANPAQILNLKSEI